MFVCGNGWRWSVFLLSPSQHTENTIREIRSHSVKLVLGLRHFSVAFCSRSYQIKSNRIASTFKSNKEPYLLKFRSDYLTIITSVASNSRRKRLFFQINFSVFLCVVRFLLAVCFVLSSNIYIALTFLTAMHFRFCSFPIALFFVLSRLKCYLLPQ